jgi:hypothetical protein
LGKDFMIKDFTRDEISLAKNLYKNFYNNPNEISKGEKPFGICYLPKTVYDMEKYTVKE